MKGQRQRGMLGESIFGPVFQGYLLRSQRVTAAGGLLLLLGLPGADLHAELLFRSFEQANGQPRWSPLRKYDSPTDSAGAADPPNASARPAQEVRVFLSGQITRTDLDSAAAMERLVKSGRQKIAGNAVWFASSGGDIDTAMELGRVLRRLGLYTVVGKNDLCLSACVFAFMGGERRSVAGQIGIHRPYFPFTAATPDRPARFRHLAKTLKAFIEEMDFPGSLYEAVMLVPPESMQMLDTADLKRFYLEGISPSSEDLADAAAARRLNLSMREFLNHKALAPACDFFAAGESRCEGKVRAAAASGDTEDDPLSLQASEAAPAGAADADQSGRLIRRSDPPGIHSRGPT